jgi:branched-chain amino acid transport system permease protein
VPRAGAAGPGAALWKPALILIAVYAGLIVLPHLLSFSQKEIAVFLLINVLLVASYRVLTLTGEWSLGHAVIMGVGAYASALYAKALGFPVPLAMLLGAATAGLVAYVFSFPLFRMKGFYFLIGSFAAGEVIRLLWKRFRDPFGGPKGIKGIPGLSDIEIGTLEIAFWDPVNYYYFCLLVVTLSLVVLYRFERSRFGLTFHAVHWQDKLAESVGVDTRRTRTLAFVVASFFGGLAGALLAHYIGTVNPNRFDVEEMVFVLIWVIVGGTATFFGPIIGVVVLTIVNEMVLREMGVDQARPLIYGAILIASVLFLPQGLESLGPKVKRLFAGRPGGPDRRQFAGEPSRD